MNETKLLSRSAAWTFAAWCRDAKDRWRHCPRGFPFGRPLDAALCKSSTWRIQLVSGSIWGVSGPPSFRSRALTLGGAVQSTCGPDFGQLVPS
jgi:hypothetical protein